MRLVARSLLNLLQTCPACCYDTCIAAVPKAAITLPSPLYCCFYCGQQHKKARNNQLDTIFAVGNQSIHLDEDLAIFCCLQSTSPRRRAGDILASNKDTVRS